MTNFRIYYMESRPYWVQRGILSARSHGCAEGPAGPGVPMVDAETRVGAWVGPWQYQCRPLGGYWVGGRVVPTQYPVYPLPVPGIPPSRYPPARPPVLQCGLDETAALRSTKEILGIEYAPTPYMVYRSVPHASPDARLPPGPSWPRGGL